MIRKCVGLGLVLVASIDLACSTGTIEDCPQDPGCGDVERCSPVSGYRSDSCEVNLQFLGCTSAGSEPDAEVEYESPDGDCFFVSQPPGPDGWRRIPDGESCLDGPPNCSTAG